MAGRTPRPWFRSSKNAWYVHLNGNTIRLGRDKGEAFRTFHRLMAGVEPHAPTSQVAVVQGGVTFGELIARYLDDLGRRVTPRTLAVAKWYLGPVVSACGRLEVGRQNRHRFEAAVLHRPTWGPTTANHVLSRMAAAFNWAEREGLIPANPIKGVRKPSARSRGTDALVAEADYRRLYDAAPPYLKDVLLALHDTGARPCEVLTAEARHFDPAGAVWVLDRHKTAHVTGRPRLIFLTPAVVEVCTRLAWRHPIGPLFRTARGRPFPPGYYLARLVREVAGRAGVSGVTPYSLRHTFATDALAAGVPDAQVAELLGHTGTAMLHRHYAHLTGKARVLRDALTRVRQVDG
jgi:integrase